MCVTERARFAFFDSRQNNLYYARSFSSFHVCIFQSITALIEVRAAVICTEVISSYNVDLSSVVTPSGDASLDNVLRFVQVRLKIFYSDADLALCV